MEGNLLTAAIAAGAALAGGALAHWGALRLQAQRFTHEREQQQRDFLRRQRAEFLGWVLEARVRIEARMPSRSPLPAVSADKAAAVAARKAYAVALLYLVDVRPLAMAFYQSTAKLQLALEKPIEEGEVAAAVGQLSAAWRHDLEAIEAALAARAASDPG